MPAPAKNLPTMSGGWHTKRPPRRTERQGGRVPFFQFRYTMFSRMSLSATSAMNSLFVGFSVPM